MDIVISFFRDTISGSYYFIYATIGLTLMFAIIGYLYKGKYGKVEFKLTTNTTEKANEKKEKNSKKDKKKNIEEVPKQEVQIQEEVSTYNPTPPALGSLKDIPTSPNLNEVQVQEPVQVAPIEPLNQDIVMEVEEPVISEQVVEITPEQTNQINNGSIPEIK